MLGLKKRESSTLALKSANLLNLNDKRKIHEAVYIKKGLAGKLPIAICEEYNQHQSRKNNRSADKMLLTIPKHKSQQYENSYLAYLERNKILCKNQHGFRKGRSCLTQLIYHIYCHRPHPAQFPKWK